MKTLDSIYKEYTTERTPEIEEILCKRIEKLAGIVLSKFKIRKKDSHDRYEEYMQQAYLLFFELLETFDPNVGKLEGYFMVSFKWHLIEAIKDRLYREGGIFLVGEEVLDEKNPYNMLLVDDLVEKLYNSLTKNQQIVATYMLIGIRDAEEIARLEDVPPKKIRGLQNGIQIIAKKLFFDGGEMVL